MARLVLVRHGRPRREGKAPARWTLSAEGRRAVQAVSHEAVWEPAQRIYSSPERKARETAKILAAPRGIPVEIREDLREIQRPFEARGYEDKLRAFLKGETPPGWEIRDAAEARIQESMEEISRGGIDAGVVSHALLLTLFLASTMGTEPAFWLHHSIGFAEVALYDTATRTLVRGFGEGEGARPAE